VAGSVRLAFTVMPNGEITNIVPVKKANPTLLAEAIRRLNGAKVKPLPSSVPQLTVRWALTFNFELR
jgi:outer membrane biosynthesis protein TonB